MGETERKIGPATALDERQVQIEMNSLGVGRVVIDGKDVSGMIEGFSVHGRAGRFPQVQLDMGAFFLVLEAKGEIRTGIAEMPLALARAVQAELSKRLPPVAAREPGGCGDYGQAGGVFRRMHDYFAKWAFMPRFAWFLLGGLCAVALHALVAQL